MPVSTAAARRQRRQLRQAAGVSSPLKMFFKGFLKHPVMVGAIVPSSNQTIKKMLSRCDWPNTRVFVEYGPGVGTFCRTILDALPADATYIAIDTNPDFIRYLRHEIVDPRFSAILGSAADVIQIVKDHGHDEADYVLSGLPFSTLPAGVGDAIGQATADVLRVGGAFLVYQYSPKCRDFIEPYLPKIDHAMEWWNLPPAQLYWGWKE